MALFTLSSDANAENCSEVGRYSIFQDTTTGWVYLFDSVTGQIKILPPEEGSGGKLAAGIGK